MSRTSKLGTMRWCLLSTLTAATLLAGLLPTAARAVGYVFQQHVLNAGVLVNGSDPAPYLFYVMNQRPDVRPTDLTLVNPLASATAQQNTAAYWEVPLNTVSDAQLAEYNVLYLRADNVSFGPAINEHLRRFVDNGGQLIVEYGTVTTPSAHGLFVGTSPASGAGAIDLPQTSTSPITYLRHPIVSQPFLLSGPDVAGFGTIANSISGNGESGNLFSQVLVDTTGSVVSAAQIGAGQVVVSALNLGTGISVNSGATYTQTDLYKANTSDLKLLANILTWSETHPNENKSSHGNASGIGLASFTPAWQYPVSSPATSASSAAVWGNFVFVTGADGRLHVFDAFPSENLIGGPTTDDGILDYSPLPIGIGSGYDEIWNTPKNPNPLGAGASAPTVAAFKGVNYVFVEKPDGSVLAFNAVTGASYTLPSAPAALTGYTGGPYPVAGANAPAPTYYDGRLYAGQADGTLNVYDLNENTCVQVPLDPTIPTGTAETVTGSPAVGTLANGDTNVLVAVVPTNYDIYSVLLGARNEPLLTFSVNNSIAGYSIARQRRYDVTNLFADTNMNAVPPLVAYDYNGNVYPTPLNPTPPNNTAPNPQDPLFSISSNLGYYTDWDMDFAAAVGPAPATPSPVNLNYISADSYNYLSQTATPVTTVSAAAVDRLGDYYYTQNDQATGSSYLVGVQNALLFSSVHLKFRFLMPGSTDGATYGVTSGGALVPWDYKDADGVDYTPLIGYQFVGAPVVDDLGNVYVAATKGSLATVLCFRGDQQTSAAEQPAGTPPDLTQVAIYQGSLDNTITKGLASDAYGGQYTAPPPPGSSIDFYNYASSVRRNGIEILGNLTEPQQVIATDQTTAGAPSVPMKMRTNLAWFLDPTTFTTSGAITGLSRVGSSLFLSDGTNLYRLPTSPQIGAGKKVVSTPLLPIPSITPLNPNTGGVGVVGAAPSIGGNVMVVNGSTGIAALTRQVTIIADNNRILGVDGDGGAVWSVDATTRTDLSSGISTKVSFAHPTSLSQFALNDYLVADTGNDRCVRFDSGGNVQWELTRFTDPNGLMASGQPLTLSQPSSVVTRQGVVPASDPPPYAGGTATYYLIADSGNNRVLEVADIVDTGGTLHPDILTWVSHTGDQNNRNYRYGCAAYYDNPSPPAGYSNSSIAATVTNTRLAPLSATGQLGSASSDAAGGSIVVFNRPLTQKPFSLTPLNDLAYTTSVFYSQTPTQATSGTYISHTVTHPRFLQLYTPLSGATAPPGTAPAFDFLYADDNGTFDLTYVVNGTKSGFVAGPDRLQFTPTDYQNMQYQSLPIPAFGVGPVTRTNLPFIPTCVQGLNTDSQPSGANTLTTRRYLITQNYSQGELGGPPNAAGKLGGEVFEVDVTATSTTSTGAVTTATQTPVGGFAGTQTLSHPALTGPLTQPTFGVRLP